MERFSQGCRRRFPRFPLASTMDAGGADGKASWTGWGTDLGCGGVRISAPAPLPEGRRLLVRLQTSAGPLAREAEVCWTGLRAGLAGPAPGRPHGLRFLVPLPEAVVRALTRPPTSDRPVPPPQERTVPIEAVTLPDIPIAGGGLFVRCSDPFRLGSLVHLRLLPAEGAALSIAGRVVWANAGGHNPFPPGMGVQVLECPPEEAARLKALVERNTAPGRPAMAEAWYAVRPGQAAHALAPARSVL